MEKNTVVTIELDRIRELRCSHKAMKRWSAHTGKKITDMDTNALDPSGVEELMYFLMEEDAHLHGDDLKMEQMEDLLDAAPLGYVYEKLGEAVTAAFQPTNEKNAKRAANGTGKNA